MDILRKVQMQVKAGAAARKIEEAGITDEVMTSLKDGLPEMPEDTAKQLNMFREEVGHDTFNSIAAGGSLDKMLEEWRYNRSASNFNIMFERLQAKVPTLEKEEFEALLILNLED